jgi:glycosidase
MDGVLDFWMQKGVAGFRIDAVSRLFEDPQMRDDPYLPAMNAYGDRNIKQQYQQNLIDRSLAEAGFRRDVAVHLPYFDAWPKWFPRREEWCRRS